MLSPSQARKDYFEATNHNMEKIVVLRSDLRSFESIQLTREKSTVVIGRSRSVDYRIDHPQVSGLQCTVRLEDPPGQRVLVTDSSTNGTFVNGVEVARGETRELPVGATMTILIGSVAERDVEFGQEVPCFRVELRHERPKPANPVRRLLVPDDAALILGRRCGTRLDIECVVEASV